VPDEQGVLKPGLGGICIFWFVEDIDKSAEMIEKAGGNMVGDVVPEGDSGVYRYFVDTEGSMAGVYQYRPSTKE
jgi:predicted enzyme related to lactoylglutathione lyase